MKVTAYKPQAIVTLYTETGDLVARATNDPNSSIDDDIVNITTSRDLGADCPTFTINLTRAKDWHKWVTSNDLIRVEMQRPPENKEVVFFGLVDDVRKRTALTGDSVERVITITGRGLGKSTISFDAGIVPEIGTYSRDVGWLVSNGVNLSGRKADQIISDIWNFFGKDYINYKWKNNQTLYSLVNLRIEGNFVMTMMSDFHLLDWNGSIWSLLKEVAEEPFYELFWEIYDGTPSLVVRPTPFNSSEWNGLPKLEINDEEVIIDDIGRSDLETYTVYSVGAKALMTEDDPFATMGLLPYWYEPYADKYGVRRLHALSIYTALADEGDEVDVINLMTQMQKDLYNWNINNNNMFNGSFVVRGSNRFKVGQRLVYKNTADNTTLEYYIVAVHHNFINFGNWTTQINVTRGMEASKRFSSPVGSHTDFHGIGIEPLSIAAGTYDPSTEYDWEIPVEGNVTLGNASSVVSGATSLMRSNRVRYVFGGPGIDAGRADCSQFTQYIFRKYGGVDIGRTTGTQVTKGRKISKNNMVPGDLVFFKNTYKSSHIYGVSHVGIYVGNGEFMHLSSGANGIIVSKLSSSYWTSKWLMARRVLEEASKTTSTTSSGGSSNAGFTTFEATAYGANIINLGAPPGWVATGKTASGATPKEGRTIAVDRTVIPLGSTVEIKSDYPGISGVYTAEDVGGAIKGNKVDIYFNDLPPYDPYQARKRMLKFGRRSVQVKVLKRGD